MSIFRIKIESDSEAVLLENSLPLMLGPFEYPPCLLGHSLGQAKNGLLGLILRVPSLAHFAPRIYGS